LLADRRQQALAKIKALTTGFGRTRRKPMTPMEFEHRRRLLVKALRSL
jgi:hypothetical protein